MIIDWTKIKILIKPGNTDFRKQINGLALIVENDLKLNAFSNYLFLFCSKNRSRLKILYWDRNGFCLWLKRLEKDKFPWPKNETEAREITYDELKLLLDGIDFFHAHKILNYKTVA
jgi:transposase